MRPIDGVGAKLVAIETRRPLRLPRIAGFLAAEINAPTEVDLICGVAQSAGPQVPSGSTAVQMRHVLSILAITFIMPMTAALAKDRRVTDQERPKLEATLKEAGCNGGKMEFDDDKGASHPNGKFEVDRCDLSGRQEV